MTQLDTLPNELILIIADYVDLKQNPKGLIPLMETCKSFYFTLRPKLYNSIYCFTSFDESILNADNIDNYYDQTLIYNNESFMKLAQLLSTRDDLLSMVNHFNFECLNFNVENKFVSSKLIKSLNEINELISKPINFYTQSSQIKNFTNNIFNSFILQNLQNHKSLDGSKQLLSENALVNNVDEKSKIARDDSVSRLLFCPLDFENYSNNENLIQKIILMTDILTKLKNEKDIHISIMNLQNVMTESSIRNENNDLFMKLNVMNHYIK